MNQRFVWNNLANSWNNFRQKPIKGLKEFKDYIKGRSLFIGCGNGRNFTVFKNIKIFGIDFSENMIYNAIKTSKKNRIDAHFIVGNENLPFRNNFFDSIVFLSSLQCMKNRAHALNECKRVLKEDGIILISVWNRWQWRFFPKNIFTSEFFIKWRKKDSTYYRYYHLYSKNEIEKEMKMFKIEKVKIVEGNIFILGIKTNTP